ncbi:hypothetical protein BJV82DRAFT_715051 [Fennellomyces sp. T-0311]|nr:hypothetical protein BJV82DRAFT_715051 [Fennellomyces sp. T-0311]
MHHSSPGDTNIDPNMQATTAIPSTTTTTGAPDPWPPLSSQTLQFHARHHGKTTTMIFEDVAAKAAQRQQHMERLWIRSAAKNSVVFDLRRHSMTAAVFLDALHEQYPEAIGVDPRKGAKNGHAIVAFDTTDARVKACTLRVVINDSLCNSADHRILTIVYVAKRKYVPTPQSESEKQYLLTNQENITHTSKAVSNTPHLLPALSITVTSNLLQPEQHTTDELSVEDAAIRTKGLDELGVSDEIMQEARDNKLVAWVEAHKGGAQMCKAMEVLDLRDQTNAILFTRQLLCNITAAKKAGTTKDNVLVRGKLRGHLSKTNKSKK